MAKLMKNDHLNVSNSNPASIQGYPTKFELSQVNMEVLYIEEWLEFEEMEYI